jgi:transposase
MQMQMPIFPETTKLINSSVGVFSKDGFIYYLHNGSPIFCHNKDKLSDYRYILGNLVVSKLCTPVEISKTLGVHKKSVERYAKKLKTIGIENFFHQKDHRGECYKMTESVLAQAQEYLNTGYSQLRTAKMIGVSESCIRYHIKSGVLKKNESNTANRKHTARAEQD